MARALLKGAAFAGLCGAVGYFATDAVESALLFRTGSRCLQVKLEHKLMLMDSMRLRS